MAGTKLASAPRPKLASKVRDALHDQLLRERAAVFDLFRNDLQAGKTADEGSEDLVDIANRAYSQELVLALSESERTLVRDIDGALRRFELGTYGVCEYCGGEIGEPRLKAVPWARYCIDCQERDENGMLDS